jgi:hypothetical protein
MTRDLLDWILLGRAIKTGDVGLMKAMLPRLFFCFSGGGNPNYAIEIAEIIQGFAQEWPPDLQYVAWVTVLLFCIDMWSIRAFILRHGWLVNLRGARDSHMPVDMNQEHNIRDSKV